MRLIPLLKANFRVKWRLDQQFCSNRCIDTDAIALFNVARLFYLCQISDAKAA